ncbi:hypothetical protein [Nesterenkonia sp. F]|uniref:hypothetical protein n=1 Tax=Nesterenkonia sp. F TaxID=795955 RepID=UPI000255D5A3|nr:hypothetical protein [Nesterenkonia sp. F]
MSGEESPEPLDDPQEAEELFEDFQDLVSETAGFRAEGSTTVEGQTQRADMAFDAQDGGFEGTVSVSGGNLDMDLEVIRANDLTWIKGPTEYWESLGYPSDGASVAEGMYVVFEMSAGDAVADPYDYARLLEQTTAVAMSDITVEGTVESSQGEAFRYVLGGDEDSPWLELPSNGDLDSARYVSTANDLEADVRFWGFGADVDVEAPPPDEVLGGMEGRSS